MKKLFKLIVIIAVFVSIAVIVGVVTNEPKGTKLIYTASDPTDHEIMIMEQLKCQIDSFTSQNLGEKMVPINFMGGNMDRDFTEVEFDGVTAMVKYNSGENDWPDGGQSFLVMSMNDEDGSSVNSSMYDIQLKSQSGPINVLHLNTLEKQVRLQC